jgi:hypothetical protein
VDQTIAIMLISLFAVQQATAQQPQPDFQIVAQAYDRCMATYAVRLTRTAATDEDIFLQARQSCLPLKERLRAAIRTQVPPEHVAEFLQAIDVDPELRFMAMLARIRSDRARRESR